MKQEYQTVCQKPKKRGREEQGGQEEEHALGVCNADSIAFGAVRNSFRTGGWNADPHGKPGSDGIDRPGGSSGRRGLKMGADAGGRHTDAAEFLSEMSA